MHDLFSLRRDRNGLRPVFTFGNLLGSCPFNCNFCGVKAGPVVTEEETRRRFQDLLAVYRYQLDGPWHPLVYNGGNVTSSAEFSQTLLTDMLLTFRSMAGIQYVSINSRERTATPKVLDHLRGLRLPFPIHFIFGLETSHTNARRILGKNTRGELERFVNRLVTANTASDAGEAPTFGLDVNIVFLPELYIAEHHRREDSYDEIRAGAITDLQYILSTIDHRIPGQINIHPYYKVDLLPYADVDLNLVINILPELQTIADGYNQQARWPLYLFLGVEGKGYQSAHWTSEAAAWQASIDIFNRTGRVDPRH